MPINTGTITHTISLGLNSPSHIINFLSKLDSIKGFFRDFLQDSNFTEENLGLSSTDLYYRNGDRLIFSFPRGGLKSNVVYTMYLAGNDGSKHILLEFRIHPRYEDNPDSDPKNVDIQCKISRKEFKFTPKSINIRKSEDQNFTPREKLRGLVDQYAKRVAVRISDTRKIFKLKGVSKK